MNAGTYTSLLLLLDGVRGEDSTDAAQLLAGLRRDQLEAVTLALAILAGDDLPLTELRSKANAGDLLRELWLRSGAKLCEPQLWGGSAGSRAAHGTRARYNAGCRGAACTRAERTYSRERKRRASTVARAAREAEEAAQIVELRRRLQAS